MVFNAYSNFIIMIILIFVPSEYSQELNVKLKWTLIINYIFLFTHILWKITQTQRRTTTVRMHFMTSFS